MRITAGLAVLLFSLLTLVLPARAIVQSPADAASMPAGPGKDLVLKACVGCHALEITTGWRAPRDEWDRVVAQMITVGAKLSREEAAVVVDYLAEHYAPLPETGAPVPGPQSSPSTVLPDGPGRDVLTAKCYQCHGRGMWQDLRLDRRGWEGVVYRMVGKGALWTEDEINAMVDYLARVLPPVAESAR